MEHHKQDVAYNLAYTKTLTWRGQQVRLVANFNEETVALWPTQRPYPVPDDFEWLAEVPWERLHAIVVQGDGVFQDSDGLVYNPAIEKERALVIQQAKLQKYLESIPTEGLLHITFNDNYADEFDIDGWSLQHATEWRAFVETVIATSASFPHEYYFGTNESLTWPTALDYLDSFTHKAITEEDANAIQRVFTAREGGFFPDDLEFDDEDEDDEDYGDPSEPGHPDNPRSSYDVED